MPVPNLGPIKLASLGRRPTNQRLNTTGNADLIIEQPLGGFTVSSVLSLLLSHLCLYCRSVLLADKLKLRVWDLIQGTELFKTFSSADGPSSLCVV